ncbi:MAG: class I SAM-dependent methyltransferase [Desulfobulbaceae bacterium]|nr:MAG: class I SAM-dependent methyltransferase [Desulfobulbaceae bacterium]
MDYFLEIYGSLPRAGPGSVELTQRAFEMIPSLPKSPRILDVGCGPGMQTVELLRSGAGTVVALDFLPEMIERVSAEAERAGVSDRLEAIVQDMKEMTFPASSFDVIWSEGAIYNLGFDVGLREFRELVKPGGYVAVSEAVWLKAYPPSEVIEFWREYPEIDTVAAKLKVIRRNGYEVLGHFVFPASAWTDQYYDPMERRIAEKAKDWRGIPEAEAVLSEARNEISIFRQYSDYFSYAFFVMRG